MLNMLLRICLLLFGIANCKSQLIDDFTCPDEYKGYYPHLLSCDKYWYCQDGVKELKTCGNGLGFLDTDETFTLEQCAELHLVECGARTQLEPAISTTNCPRLYGTFADLKSCSVFYKCINGKANRYECPPGLAYDKIEKGCKWADQVPECKNVLLTIDGENEEFKCPRSAIGAFTKHAHPADCRQYFVCISGVPREYGCPLGTVFSIGNDEFSGKCTDPSEVIDCKNYYGDLEFDSISLSKSGADTGRIRNRNNKNNSKNTIQNELKTNRFETKEIKERPVPPSLQSIIDDKPLKPSKITNLVKLKPQVRQNLLKTSFDSPRNKTIPLSLKETPNLNRLEVITNRNILQERKTSTTAPSTTTTILEIDTTKNLNVLPDPVKAAPGPNGEDYYYYYYYYDDEESLDSSESK